MLKKILAILLAAGIVLGGTSFASAEGLTSRTSKTGTLAALKEWKANADKVKPLLKTIQDNRTRLAGLRSKANASYKAAKSKIKKLLKNKNYLTTEQMKALKAAVKTLAEDKKLLESTIGDMNKANEKLKSARQKKDAAAYSEALGNIISIQNSRIRNLEKITGDFNKITDM